MPLKSIGERVIRFHEAIRERFDSVWRIAVALHDPADHSLQTFVSSSVGEKPFDHYQMRLDDVPSLQVLRDERRSRVINDFARLAGSPALHTQRLIATGIRSSYTVPMFSGDDFIGFVFFDAGEVDYFSAPVIAYLSLYAQLITALIAGDLSSIRTLRGALMTARAFSRFRDEETADHLSRITHYCRLIAVALSGQYRLDDEYIEFLFQFSALHDIGKVAIPDRILLKPSGLYGDDLETMRTHVDAGVHIVDTMIREFGFSGLDHVAILRNLVATHHERYDGSGYPAGLRGTDIPLEGRITTVADVFDALTSSRPYKPAWSFNRALGHLHAHAGTHFDPDCVVALERQVEQLRAVHARFGDGRF